MNDVKLPLPLEGLRVLDATHIVAGPFCSMLLADAGAEVIKIERPGMGDRTRHARPLVPGEDGHNISGRFLYLNRNKKSVALDLNHVKGREVFLGLVLVSDVVLENYGPGAMERLGLGYEQLQAINPQIVYASITGYGNSNDLKGPYSEWPAHNPCVQAMAGWMNITGRPDGPPEMVGDNIGDSIPAVWTAYGIMLALETRHRTGLGQHVDMAMYDCMVMHNTTTFPFYQERGEAPGRHRQSMTSAQLALQAKDGYVVLAGAVGEGKWEALWRRIGREELTADPRYLGRDVDGAFYINEVRPALEEWTRGQLKDQAVEVFLKLGFSAAMVQDAADIMGCSHLEAREMFIEFDYPVATGKYKAPTTPVKMTSTMPMPTVRPPWLGENSREVLGGLLGLTDDDIEEMCRARVVA